MTPVFFVSSFILGSIIGSFLNSVVARYQTGLGFKGRSVCFSCGHKLSFSNLFPIASFLFQKGRCSFCTSPISLQYLFVELCTGGLFVLVASKIGFSFSSAHIISIVYYWIIMSLFIVIVFYDIRHKIIPDAFVYSFIALSFLGLFFTHNVPPFGPTMGFSRLFLESVIAGPLLALPLAALSIFSRGTWMGLGDAKLALGIGWLLGLSYGAAAIILGFWIGALYGILLVLFGFLGKTFSRLFVRFKRFTIKSEIPFAPFLVLGTLIVLFYDISFSDLESLFTINF